MRTMIDGSELGTAAADAKKLAGSTLAQAQTALKGASFAVEKRIKVEMPVDTGRARASWGHWTPGDVQSGPRISLARSKKGLAAAASRGAPNAGDAVWEEEDNGLTITQGSNVPYIEILNAGHSRQAPAGFLDLAELTGQVELEKAVGLIDPLDPNLGWLSFA